MYKAEWNPSIDLIALASEKGEINTRRRLWKRGWKVKNCSYVLVVLMLMITSKLLISLGEADAVVTSVSNVSFNFFFFD